MAARSMPVTATDGPPDLMFWVNDPDMPDEPLQFPIDILLLKPRSRGSVTLRSADPAHLPAIMLAERLSEGIAALR
jgi:hypothetical protein